jgi:hypothetical protein
MSKRFIDTELWEKDWFMELTPAEKLAWVYLTTNCDNVGVWKPNFRLAEFVIGQQLDWEKFAGKCNGNIEILENGKWWLVDFIAFQHPDLLTNPDGGNSKALKSYLRDLESHGLTARFNDLAMGIEWASDGHGYDPKEKAKAKARVKARKSDDSKMDHPTLSVPIGKTRYENLCREWGVKTVDSYISRAVAYAEAHGRPYLDYAAAAWTYMQRDLKDGKLSPPPRDDGPKSFAEARAMG